MDLGGDIMQKNANDSAINKETIQKLKSFQKKDQPNILTKFIVLFLDYSNESMKQIRIALRGYNNEKLSEIAHSLKSSSHYLGALTFSNYCDQLQKLAESENATLSSITEIVNHLEIEYIKVVKELEAYKKDP